MILKNISFQKILIKFYIKKFNINKNNIKIW